MRVGRLSLCSQSLLLPLGIPPAAGAGNASRERVGGLGRMGIKMIST